MARLPQPGGDANDWGTILNEYLRVSHAADGSLKDGVVAAGAVQDDSLTGAKLKNGTVTESKLSTALAAKVNGVAGVTNLGANPSANNVEVTSSSGTNATIPAATTSDAGVLTSADKTKLNSVATNATANDTDANLLDRANHTGSQAIASVTGLQSALDGKAASSHNHSAADIISGTINTDRLGSGTADNTTYLRGDGTWATPTAGGGSSDWNIRQVTASTVDAADNDWLIADPASNSITVRLPAPAANARVRVKRAASSGNSIMMTTPNGGLLDGGEPLMATLNGGWSSQDYESDGTNWFVV